MVSYHCDSTMLHERFELRSGHVVHNYVCKVCGAKQREIRSRQGHLLSWKNLTRLAAEPKVA